MKHIAILGSTGSIGRAALDVVSHLGEEFKVNALAAWSNGDLLAMQVEQYRPELVGFGSHEDARVAAACRRVGARLVLGREGLEEVAACQGVDTVLNAVVGAAGLLPTLVALRSGKTVALANKESLVIGGELVIRETGADLERLIPVDSEHASLHIGLRGKKSRDIRSLWLTASGGALRDYQGPLADVTPAQALAHPTWNMGRKITIDSATMMNKGLEIVEAHYLFNMPLDKIHCVMHEQSIVHCLVELNDGSVLAHMAWPDMRGPIQYALTYPDLVPSPLPPLLPKGLSRLDFKPVDHFRFPCLRLVRDAAEAGGIALAAMNAANEVAVASFLAKEISFVDIPKVIESVLDRRETICSPKLEDIMNADRAARENAREVINHLRCR